MKSLRALTVAACIAAGTASAAYAADPMVDGAPMMASKNIVQNASQAKNLTTLVAAVKQAGLVYTLEGPGPFTVFAPTNAAFDKVHKATVESLMKPDMKPELKKILTYHVVAGKIDAAEIAKEIEAGGDMYNMKTVEGETLTAEMDGDQIALVDQKGGAAMRRRTCTRRTASCTSSTACSCPSDGGRRERSRASGAARVRRRGARQAPSDSPASQPLVAPKRTISARERRPSLSAARAL